MSHPNDNLSLIASVNHATDTLGLYRAELARILGLQCGDVADSVQLERILENNENIRRTAYQFIVFFNLLERMCRGDTVAMVHWLRVDHRELATTPLLAMVDDGRLEDVIQLLS